MCEPVDDWEREKDRVYQMQKEVEVHVCVYGASLWISVITQLKRGVARDIVS